ncbi:MAG: glycosyltransferase family 2 protein [Bacteroidales bacterium]
MTDLSIIIVTYKAWDRLRKCLESINSFTGDKFSFDVIVVDNNPDVSAIHDIEQQFNRFRFIHPGVNGGFAFGNNAGSLVASGKYLLFLNPDTVVTETAVQALLDASASDQHFSILTCRQTDEMGNETKVTGNFPHLNSLTGFQRALSKLFRSGIKADDHFVGIEPADWVSGSVIMISSSLYHSLGGFYEGFWMYYEDVDICKRATEAGGKIGCLRNATIEHSHGGSSRIDLKTTSITKSEVKISQHLYVSRHFKGIEKILGQLLLTVNNLVTGIVLAAVGLIFFFIPKLFVNTLIFLRLVKYYTTLQRRSWISPRSVILTTEHEN